MQTRGLSKRCIFKSLASYVIDFTGWKVDSNFAINEPHDVKSKTMTQSNSLPTPIIPPNRVARVLRPTSSLDEFLEIEENDLNGPFTVDGQRPFVSGHNR